MENRQIYFFKLVPKKGSAEYTLKKERKGGELVLQWICVGRHVVLKLPLNSEPYPPF